MNVDLNQVVLDALARSPDYDGPESYSTDPARLAKARSLVPREWQTCGIVALDNALLRSGIHWEYDLRVRLDTGADFPTPHYNNETHELHFLPPIMYDDLHRYAWTLAHELAHASAYSNPLAGRPRGMSDNFSRVVEECHADMAALLVMQQLGEAQESDIARVINYAGTWAAEGSGRDAFGEFLGIFTRSKRDTLELAAQYAQRSAAWILELGK